MAQRILVVDDDPLICRQLENLFRERHYDVDSAGNADEALALLDQYDYALGVVDLKIPGTDGLSLTRQIHERWSDFGVIIITGRQRHRLPVAAQKEQPISRRKSHVAAAGTATISPCGGPTEEESFLGWELVPLPVTRRQRVPKIPRCGRDQKAWKW